MSGMAEMFPDAQSGIRKKYEGAIWNRPPELPGAVRLWRCGHQHAGHDEAIMCALAEIRQRWHDRLEGGS